MHVLWTFFVLYIIKGSAYGSYTAYGSYSLRTVFASIVLRSLVLRSVWSSFVESFGLFVLRENFASCLDRFCAIIGLFRSQGRTLLRVWIELCDYWTVPFSGENFASCLDRFVRLLDCSFSGRTLLRVWIDFVRLLDCSVLRGELCFVFGSICAIIGLFRSQGRTLLRVWIDLCDYWTVPFSGENFASCLDRFVRLLDCSVLRGELCFVFGSICAIIDNYLVLRGELCFVLFGSICDYY